MQMAVCRFCLCRIDPTKVQVATYVQGTHLSTHTRRRIGRGSRAAIVIDYTVTRLAEDTQRRIRIPNGPPKCAVWRLQQI